MNEIAVGIVQAKIALGLIEFGFFIFCCIALTIFIWWVNR